MTKAKKHMALSNENIIEIADLGNYLGGNWVHQHLNLNVKRGESIAIIGASGCGKTTLLRTILMLRRQQEGSVKVFGVDTGHISEKERLAIQQRWGVMFQSSALFSSFTVLENVMFPLQLFTHTSAALCREIAMLKIVLVGLPADAAYKYPSELSGGMKKRAALARAIAVDPELLFLDEPTAGLDPKSAEELDDLVLHLQENLGITFIMVTHDLDTLWKVPDRVVFIGEGRVLAAEPMPTLVGSTIPAIQDYFAGPRSQVRIPEKEGSNGK